MSSSLSAPGDGVELLTSRVFELELDYNESYVMFTIGGPLPIASGIGWLLGGGSAAFLAAAVYLGLTAISLSTAVTAAIIGDTTVTSLQVAAAKRIKFWVRTRNDPYRLHVDCLTGHSKVQRLEWRAAGRLTPQARQVVDTLIQDGYDGSVGALVDAAPALAS